MAIILDVLRSDDLPLLFAWLNDRSYRLHSGSFDYVSYAQHEAWFERVSRSPSDVALAVRRQEELVGLAQLVAINRVSRNAEFRIKLDPDRLDQGLGSEATHMMCQHAFDDLNLDRIYLYVQERNQRAVKCYQKVGFRREGTLRQHAYVDGEARDVLVMGLLRDEFR